MASLAEVAPAFVEMAHRIVWATVATTDRRGRPATRILHPIWEWDGTELTGWIATSPNSLKAAHLQETPHVSITYWTPSHDTCTANCNTSWEQSAMDLQTGWERFLNGPEPVGYDPAIIPQWPSPQAPEFGMLRLEPVSLRVMPGTMMTAGKGRLLTWKR
jgi:general stress protein 26